MYIDDFIPTLANCAPNFRSGDTVNIGGEEYRSVEDLHNIVSDLLGIDRVRPEVAYLSQDGHNTVNKRPSIDKAKKYLGHNPTIKLEEGMRRTLRWMWDTYATARGINPFNDLVSLSVK